MKKALHRVYMAVALLTYPVSMTIALWRAYWEEVKQETKAIVRFVFTGRMP